MSILAHKRTLGTQIRVISSTPNLHTQFVCLIHTLHAHSQVAKLYPMTSGVVFSLSGIYRNCRTSENIEVQDQYLRSARTVND